ncbi:MAG: hypothetical protein U9Q99_00305 [Nanoarchaeota archaeon]|nr:hypothetical protein [Nanoarchaeota archaeon]
MKKIFFFFLFFIFLLNFVSAIDIEVKSDVKQGENLIVKVSGKFLTTLTEDNLVFYRRHMPTSFGIYEVVEMKGDYYIYVQIPEDKTPDNYSVVIQNIKYYSGSKIINAEVRKNFTILDEKASFSITPGLLVYEDNSIIEIQNLKDTKIKIFKGFFKKKEIPFFNESNESNGTSESNETSENFWELFFKKEEYNTTNFEIKTEKDTRENFELISGEIKELKVIPENYSGFQKIWFNYEEENYYVYVLVEGDFIPKIEENKTEFNETNVSEVNTTIIEVPNSTEEDKDIEIKTCEEMEGFVCNSSSKCEGDLVDSKKSKCCLGECVLKQETNTGKIIGWVLIIALILFVTWFFKEKYKKPKKTPIDLEKQAKGKKEISKNKK